MRRQLMPALMMVVLFTLLTGIVYGLAVTGVAQVVFPHEANGSIIEVNGREVGSELIGQAFVDEEGNPLTEYFQPRPSAATTNDDAGYDPSLSLGSNLGPTNPSLMKSVVERVKAYRELNRLGANTKVPVDAVTASASGLDPHISIANARIQAKRIAEERSVPVRQVLDLVDEHTDGRFLGFIGEKGVNVLELNLALDRLK